MFALTTDKRGNVPVQYVKCYNKGVDQLRCFQRGLPLARSSPVSLPQRLSEFYQFYACHAVKRLRKAEKAFEDSVTLVIYEFLV